MSIQMISRVIMWKPKNFLQALLPIYILNFLFCHGAVEFLNVDKSKTKYLFLYTVITLVIHLSSYMYVLFNYFDPHWASGYLISYFINTNITFFVMIINIVVGWAFKTVSENC